MQKNATSNESNSHSLLKLALQFDLVCNKSETTNKKCLEGILSAVGVLGGFEKLLALLHKLRERNK